MEYSQSNQQDFSANLSLKVNNFIEGYITSKNFLLQDGLCDEMLQSFYCNLITSSYQMYDTLNKDEKVLFCTKIESLFSDLKREDLYLIVKNMEREHIKFLFYILSGNFNGMEENEIY